MGFYVLTDKLTDKRTIGRRMDTSTLTKADVLYNIIRTVKWKYRRSDIQEIDGRTDRQTDMSLVSWKRIQLVAL